MGLELAGIIVAITRRPGHYELYVGIQSFICLQQKVAALFRRESSQEKNVTLRLPIPSGQSVRGAPLAQQSSIWDIKRFSTVAFPVMLPQRSRDDHRSARQTRPRRTRPVRSTADAKRPHFLRCQSEPCTVTTVFLPARRGINENNAGPSAW